MLNNTADVFDMNTREVARFLLDRADRAAAVLPIIKARVAAKSVNANEAFRSAYAEYLDNVRGLVRAIETGDERKVRFELEDMRGGDSLAKSAIVQVVKEFA